MTAIRTAPDPDITTTVALVAVTTIVLLDYYMSTMHPIIRMSATDSKCIAHNVRPHALMHASARVPSKMKPPSIAREKTGARPPRTRLDGASTVTTHRQAMVTGLTSPKMTIDTQGDANTIVDSPCSYMMEGC